MSVRQNERGEGNLQVLNACRNLAVYTVNVCKQEKVFPKSQRWIMSKPIVDECLQLYSCIKRANAVLVHTSDEFAYRHMQQVEAHSHLEALLTLIDLAYGVFGIDSQKVSYWTGLALETDKLLKGWTKSDTTRYRVYAKESANPSNANNVYNVKTDGSLNNNNANNSNGGAPDCEKASLK